MTITLSPETMQLLEDRMRIGGFDNFDDAVRDALLNSFETEPDRSPETLAAIQRGLAQSIAGKSRLWSEVEKDLIKRYSED